MLSLLIIELVGVFKVVLGYSVEKDVVSRINRGLILFNINTLSIKLSIISGFLLVNVALSQKLYA